MKFTYPSGSRPLEGYTIKRGVGRGGFGEVYYAVSDAGKEVAMKLIRRNLDVELRGIKQCLNLKHTNLLQIYDIRDDEAGDTWVLMEYVHGERLDQVIDRHPQGMPTDDVLWWIHQVGAGTAYLHDRGIVHRDLKPANLFSEEGVVQVGDHGLSKFISCSRRSGQTESVGTVHYMAPEVANGRYGKEIDIYALGIILYEMLTGHVPFDGESIGEILMKHLTGEPDLKGIEEPYRSVIADALCKDPELRISSVPQFLARLPQPGQPVRTVTVAPPPLPSRRDHTDPGAQQPAAKPGAADVAAAAVKAPADAKREEPVWRGIRESLLQLRDAWRGANFNLLTKLVLLAVGICILVFTSSVWVSALIFGSLVYAVYWVVRALLMGGAASTLVPAGEEANDQQARAGPADQRPGHRKPDQWHRMDAPPRQHVMPSRRRKRELPDKTGRQKVTELLGSMLLSAIVALALGVVAWALIDPSGTGDLARPEQIAWLVITGTVGAWAVLAPAKFWEGREGEPMLRRFVMLVMGLLVGLTAYFVAEGLFVELAHNRSFSDHSFNDANSRLFQPDGTPTLALHLTYFGFLFLVLRWWFQADPLRAGRLSFWSTALCALGAWILYQIWPFPLPWGILAALVISISLQLASPWVPHPERYA